MSSIDDKALTPMLKQYYDIKSKYSDCVLFFRLGDFYEMFNDDAHIASATLGLTLTRKAAGNGKFIPLAGIPYHSYENYIYRLIKKGYKVAICEQLEDPSKAKGIVKRDVIRIISPGTALSDNILQDRDFNFLCAFNIEKENAGYKIGISFLDLSTGKFIMTEFDDDSRLSKFETELNKFSPQEYIIPEGLMKKIALLKEIIGQKENIRINEKEEWKFDFRSNYDFLLETLNVASLEGFGCHDKKLAVGCAGALVKYIEETQMVMPEHLKKISAYDINDFLIIDNDTRRNLELTSTMRDGSREFSLLWALDKTVLHSGARLLKDWILNPLIDVVEIRKRQSTVSEFNFNQSLRSSVRNILKNIYDIERILSKISCKTATPKDLVALKLSISHLPELKIELAPAESELLKNIVNDFDECRDIHEFIDRSIDDNPPAVLNEGGIIKKGYNAEVDELKKIKYECKDFLIAMEERERERTGIQSLKIKFNNVIGYFLEITKANLDKIPADYIRKQSMANGERYYTPELKEFESKAVAADEKLFLLEEQLFNEIREKINAEMSRIQKMAAYLACIDVLAGLAETSAVNNYIQPEINNDTVISIKNSRHPVIELISVKDKFVENDVDINCSDNMLQIITGPNMAGKSTYIRQAALLVLMAQTGSFIPAKSAKIGVVDKIFTRVGASDNLVRGQSTFMVEMIETANILNNATSRSLIILDEIGRGTSTFDGLSLAWSIAEYISLKIKAKTLFATHYHEIIELCKFVPGVKNYNIAVREWNDKIIFLRKIVDGGVSRSYGIQVARLAGLPDEVISRAKEILYNLETNKAANPVDDMPLFTFSAKNSTEANASTDETKTRELQEQVMFYHSMLEMIRQFDINARTPVDCMNFLNELKTKI